MKNFVVPFNKYNASVPEIGYGTWLIENKDAYECVSNAIKCGYTHIDSAQDYGNEVEVGRAIRECGLPREQIYLTTKVASHHKSYEAAKKSIEESLRKLDIGYIDLIFEDDGEIVIRDYKSKAEFKNDKELKEYARQMYLYSTYVKKEYGKFPKELQFLNFRKTMEPKIIAFDEDDYNEAIEWANDTVREIRNAFAYPPVSLRCGDFYANELCNHRKYCMYNEAVIKKTKEEKDE